MRVATWNIKARMDKKLQKHNIDICALQETNKKVKEKRR